MKIALLGTFSPKRTTRWNRHPCMIFEGTYHVGIALDRGRFDALQRPSCNWCPANLSRVSAKQPSSSISMLTRPCVLTLWCDFPHYDLANLQRQPRANLFSCIWHSNQNNDWQSHLTGRVFAALGPETSIARFTKTSKVGRGLARSITPLFTATTIE